MKVLSLLLLVGVTVSIELTLDTYAKETTGKSVFIKFFAPWCGHCKSMKPSWDKLMKEFKDHPTILVADVDCDGAGKKLCDEHNVEGFPTLKHGSPDALEDYDGDREFDSLKEFATGLKPACSPANLDACTPEDKAEMTKLLQISKEDLEKIVNEASEKAKAAHKEFEEEVDKLQKIYDDLEKKKSEALKAIETPTLKLTKKVFVHKGGLLPKDHESDMGGDEGDMGGDQGDMGGDEGDMGGDEDMHAGDDEGGDDEGGDADSDKKEL